MRSIKLLFLICAATLALIGCAGQPPTPQQVVRPTIPPASSDASVVTGQVISTGNQAPIKKTYVYLARVYWNAAHTEAAFAVDLANSPVARTDQNGYFTLPQVVPSEYVVVVGDYYGANEAVRTGNGDAQIFKTEAGKTLDLGVIRVSPEVEMS
jgi:hypothetical protein